MSFEFNRGTQDAGFSPAAFALASSASSSTQSTAVDIGTVSYGRATQVQMELSVPALTTTMVPDTRTVTYIIEASSVSNFASDVHTISSEVQTGASSGGVAAYVQRVSLPPNCKRYVRGKVTLGASCTDSSAVSGTFRMLF